VVPLIVGVGTGVGATLLGGVAIPLAVGAGLLGTAVSSGLSYFWR